MAITQSQVNAIDRAKVATGAYLDDAATPAAAAIEVGFKPRYIRVENFTDRIGLEWFNGQASATSLRTVAAGTRTADTTDGITIDTDNKGFGFSVLQNKQYYWEAKE